jgi:hydrogenase expression/formation protein HypD
VNESYRHYNAREKFRIDIGEVQENQDCIAGSIMKGLKKPIQCPNFGKACTPEHPLGASMVSSEGACAAYFDYSQHHVESSPT